MKIILTSVDSNEGRAPHDKCFAHKVWNRSTYQKALWPEEYNRLLASPSFHDHKRVEISHDKAVVDTLELYWVIDIESLKDLEEIIDEINEEFITIFKDKQNPGFWRFEW